MNTNAPYGGLLITEGSHTWITVLTQLFMTRLKKVWEAIHHNSKETHFPCHGHQVYRQEESCSVHVTSR